MPFKCSILVVDDDAGIRSMLTALLGAEFEVITATSVAEARDVLNRRMIDIILTDQYLDHDAETGVQLLEWVRQRQPAAVRLLMTGRASVDDAVNAINQGEVHRFLIKPMNAAFLQSTLRSAARTVLLERSNEELLEELRRLNQDLEQRVIQRTAELEEANRQLQYKNSILERMALTDPLTGLPNRRAMDRLVKTELQRRQRHPSPLSLAVLDVDHFKNVNTQFLLPGGDHVLIWLAQILSNSLRTTDTVARIGGEEFMVLAPGTGLDGAPVLAERLRASVANNHTIYNDQAIQITASVGVAVVDAGTQTTYEAMKQAAAAALGEAKESGRNRCVVRVLT